MSNKNKNDNTFIETTPLADKDTSLTIYDFDTIIRNIFTSLRPQEIDNPVFKPVTRLVATRNETDMTTLLGKNKIDIMT